MRPVLPGLEAKAVADMHQTRLPLSELPNGAISGIFWPQSA